MSSNLATSGPRRGTYTLKHKCCVVTPTGLCGGAITCYQTGDGKSITTSNAWAHIREKAVKCTAHAEVLELEHVALENLLVRRLVGRVVHADGRPDREARRVHLATVIGEGARAREELLAVALVREVRGDLLEDDEVKRDAE